MFITSPKSINPNSNESLIPLQSKFLCASKDGIRIPSLEEFMLINISHRMSLNLTITKILRLNSNQCINNEVGISLNFTKYEQKISQKIVS